MKLRMTFAVAVAALAVGIPTAAAEPDGYQPQLQAGAQPDAFDRYLRNNVPDEQSDAFSRYLRNNTSATAAGEHPDSRADRFSPFGEVEPVAAGGRDWSTGALGALGGGLFVLLAVVGASAIRERRRLALR
jgi:hypothetical protein